MCVYLLNIDIHDLFTSILEIAVCVLYQSKITKNFHERMGDLLKN